MFSIVHHPDPGVAFSDNRGNISVSCRVPVMHLTPPAFCTFSDINAMPAVLMLA